MADETQNTEPTPDGGTPVGEDTSALKRALEAERRKARELERMLKDREKAEEEARTAKEREEMEKRGEYEKLRAADLAALKKYQDEIETLKGKERKLAISRAAIEAITSNGGIPKALEPHLLSTLEAVPDGDGFKIVAVGDPSKTAHEIVSEWKRDPEWAWAFKGVGASGGGASPHANGVVHRPWDQMSLSERTEVFRRNPEYAKQHLGGKK